MKRLMFAILAATLFGGVAAPSLARAGVKPNPCPGNGTTDVMVQVGPLCVDVYEASLWNSRTGGIQTGGPTCNPNGNDCTSIFARSVANVTPTTWITWFQAQQACANSGKRLLTNAEWQMAAAGTPNGDTYSCHTHSLISESPAKTGTFSACISNHGVYDMVGNVSEWVADWVPQSTGFPACVPPLFAPNFTNFNCFAGASTSGGPGALIRGGTFFNDEIAGVFAVDGLSEPSNSLSFTGFRCAR